MTSKRLAIFIVASILLHVVLLFFFQTLVHFLPQPAPETKSKSVKVTLVQKKPEPPALQPAKPIPKQPMFVEAPGPEAKDPNPETPLESDRSTKAASKTPGDANPFLPNQQGIDVPGIDLVNTKPSVETKGEPSPTPPKPDEKVAKTDPQQKSDNKEKPDPKLPIDPKEAKQAPQVKPLDPIPLRPESQIALTKPQPEEAPKPDPNPTPKTQQPQENTNPRSPPPPTQFSALKQQNTINGGAPMGPSQSAEARDTDLGRYKAKLFRGIGSRWYLYVQQDNGLLGVGNVKIRFYVRSDGVITNLEIVQGKNNAQLAAISRRSIMEISGQLEPFSETLKVQLGEGYTEEVTFSIY